MDFLLAQILTGLASASSLFLVAAGLTIIFGVTRVVNFAHGSLCMLGAYIGWTVLSHTSRDPAAFVGGVVATFAIVGAIGALLEATLLRRIYHAPELLQLLATFGVMLMIQDMTLWIWGAGDLTLPRAPWLRGFIRLGEERFPVYDLVLILLGPGVLGALWLLLHRTRFGTLIRAATESRDMVAALGIDQRRLFTAVFALGAGLAGMAGALLLPSGSANLHIDLAVVVDAFVVVVIGGMGSLPGAFIGSMMIGLLQVFGVLLLPKITLVLVFLVMAIVLAIRPNGLFGQPAAATAQAIARWDFVGPASSLLGWIGAAALIVATAAPLFTGAHVLGIMTEAAIAVLFASSLHLLMGPAGIASFGHAAWFGIGAYASALATRWLAAPLPFALLLAPIMAGVLAALFGVAVVRLSGVYLAMLTLAFAQIVWAVVFQWNTMTGGDNGLLGLWPPEALGLRGYYWLTLTLCTAASVLLRRMQRAPFGYALRAGRDSMPRAEAIGLPMVHLRLAAVTIAGAAAGLAGGLYGFAKGSVFPGYAGIDRSVDALLMVLLGGVQTISGPIVGALAYTMLYDGLLRLTTAWRFVLGAAILVLVVGFPRGIAGAARVWHGR